MHPTLFKIPYLPDWLGDIKSYGFMMMIAFLTGIWMAVRRAERSKANPDIVMNLGFIALIAGVIGARAMYVMHYWDERFAMQPHPWWAVLDLRAGGMEFLGGPLLVIPAVYIYLKYVAKASARWYLDMTIPSLAWGLAITRIGCFLNGCCWGAVCTDPHDPDHAKPSYPWAVQFPYGSGAMIQQYRFGQMTLPKELIIVQPWGESFPIPREILDEAVRDQGPVYQERAADYQKALNTLKSAKDAGRPPEDIKRLERDWEMTVARFKETPRGMVEMQGAIYGLDVDQMRELAKHYYSKPVHPTQLYDTVNALLLCWFLSVMFYFRRRHGVILGWFLLIYPVSRILLELIRQDNPLDFGGLTISQFLSIGLMFLGAAYLLYLRRLPEACPLAVPYAHPDDEVKKN